MRISAPVLAAGLLLCRLPPAVSLLGQDDVRWPVTMVESASLHAVEYIDPEVAWAVGERGVLLSTDDGGITWKRLPGRLTSQTLRGVSFAGRQLGIIVGGAARPYGLPSTGIVLQTHDAGTTWEPAKLTMLPQLRHVAHLDAQTALALGDNSPLFLTGVFRTIDGGRSWSGVPTRTPEDWRQGDLTNLERFLLTSCHGALVSCVGSQVTRPASIDPDVHDLRATAWVSAQHAIAAGSNGALLHSVDQGRSWQPLASLRQYALSHQFDFRAVWAKNGCIWLAGSPGTHVFRSTDGGQTWGVAETGQSLPLNALDFCDLQHGIAVGDLGAILRTQDGGSSWQVVRGAGHRAAVLFVCRTCHDVPFDVIAQFSANDQLRCHVVVVTATVPQMRQVDTAALRLGADNIERLSGSPAMLRSELTRRVLAYRPDAVVVAEDVRDAKGKQRLMRDVRAALETASDATRLASTGLSAFAPWHVKQVWRATPSSAPGRQAMPIDTSAPLPVCQSSISAALVDAFSFVQNVEDGLRPPGDRSPVVGTCLIGDHAISDPSASSTLTASLNLPFGSASRRSQPDVSADAVWLQRRAAAQHTTLALLERVVSSRGAGDRGLATLTARLPAEERARVLMWVIGRCRQHGQAPLAQQLLDVVLQRRSQDATETAAALARFRCAASAELQLFLGDGSGAQTQPGGTSTAMATPGTAHAAVDRSSTPPHSAIQVADFPDPRPKLRSGDRQSGLAVEMPASTATGDGNAPAGDAAELFAQLSPDVASQPWVQLAMASLRRRDAAPPDRHRVYEQLSRKVVDGEWRRCVAIEAWLADMRPDSRRPVPPGVIFLPFAKLPPVLDGNLSDATWREALSIDLTSSAEDPRATRVFLASDERYLFVALDCQADAADEETGVHDRARDADMLGVDHVDLCLDMDRDYCSGWQISVDRLGRGADRVDGDPGWNPTWYLATRRRAGGWLAELAIPLQELTAARPLVDRSMSAFLLGIRRPSARGMCQVWPQGAGETLRWQCCGYLLPAIHNPRAAH